MLHTWALVLGLHLWLCGTVPPGPDTPFTYIMYNTITRLPAKGFVGARGWNNVKKNIFLFPICLIVNTKSGHFGPKIKQYI